MAGNVKYMDSIDMAVVSGNMSTLNSVIVPTAQPETVIRAFHSRLSRISIGS